MKRFLLFLLFPFYLISQEVVVDLHSLGKIVYQFENNLCQKIIRLSASNKVKYEHQYHYDNNEKLVSESLIGNLGTIEYFGSKQEGFISAVSPYNTETWSDKDQCGLKEVDVSKVYDEEGRLIQKGSYHYTYEDQKLVSVFSDSLEVLFAYDNEGKKIAKKTISENGEEEEYYIFLGKHEIGSFSKEGNLQWLRIPGLTQHPDMVRAIAIETKDAIYAPIYDMRFNIVKLINIEDGNVLETRPDPFGQNLQDLKGCPWTFCSKRYDEDIALVDFGYRHYDPELREWTTLDPLMQDHNPYRYCFDNPMQYLDPDGQFVIDIPLIWTGGTALGKILVDSALIASAAWLGHKAIKKGNEWANNREIQKRKQGSIDPTLPKDPFKDPRLEDISHPKGKEKGHYKFKDKETGEIIEFDKGKPGQPGHKAHDHYHRPNPNKIGKNDWYLDSDKNPVSIRSEPSHLYPPDCVWWK